MIWGGEAEEIEGEKDFRRFFRKPLIKIICLEMLSIRTNPPPPARLMVAPLAAKLQLGC